MKMITYKQTINTKGLDDFTPIQTEKEFHPDTTSAYIKRKGLVDLADNEEFVEHLCDHEGDRPEGWRGGCMINVTRKDSEGNMYLKKSTLRQHFEKEKFDGITERTAAEFDLKKAELAQKISATIKS